MEYYSKKSIDEYTSELASKSPVPGGGGTCALVGALAAALGHMVGSLTLGKKKYAAVEPEILRLMEEMGEIQNNLLGLIDRDPVVFEPLSRAYGLPKETPEQQAEKERIMEKCLKDAASVPADTMHACAMAIDLLAEFAEKGTALAVSDAGVGAVFAGAALKGAALNIYINTKYMKDRAYAEKLDHEAEQLLSVYPAKAEFVYNAVSSRLKF